MSRKQRMRKRRWFRQRGALGESESAVQPLETVAMPPEKKPDTGLLGVYIGVGVTIMTICIGIIFDIPLWAAILGFTLSAILIGWTICKHGIPHKSVTLRTT